jgi:hypothetical protein
MGPPRPPGGPITHPSLGTQERSSECNAIAGASSPPLPPSRRSAPSPGRPSSSRRSKPTQTPPEVTTTILAKSLLDQIHVNAHADRWKAKLRTRGQADVYVVDNKLPPGSTTGWPTHPGEVHMLRNETDAPAETIAVQLLPKDAVRRIPADPPSNCPA